MSIDSLALIVTTVFGIAGVAAAYYGYRSFQSSREQLKLAREQAAQVPRIELMEVGFYQLGDAPDLLNQVRHANQEMEELWRRRAEEERQRHERERAREEFERREREERERQERQRGGFNADTVDEIGETEASDWLTSFAEPLRKRVVEGLTWPHVSSTYHSPLPKLPNLRPQKHVYEGPLPDHFVHMGIRNVGRTAAYDVTGWVWLDKSVLEPVDYFASSGVKVAGEVDGKVKVELSVRNEGGRLFPTYNDSYNFRIPVRLKKVADTSFEFEFTSPQGTPAHGTFNLLIASERR